MKYGNNIQQTNQQRYSVVDIFSTDGRIGRQAYFVYSSIILLLVLGSIAGLISKLGSAASALSYTLLAVSVAVLLMVVRLTIQRCHDFNASGWISAFAIIPFANIVFALIPGNNGLNSFGEAPQPSSLAIKIATIVIAGIMIAVVTYFALHFLEKV
ncbi:MAG TPA: DUF805 domain-containing protein [Thiotrichaceae bacterium]|nr:DUF805 domain-containing protein [Thiotrichaceae bacterium]